MFKLIRDNIPQIIKESGNVCNYATAENDELYKALLAEKLIEEVQEWLRDRNTEELVDITTVIRAMLAADGISEEEFAQLYKAKIKKNGGFEKKYIGFFPDPQPQQPQEK